MGLCFSFPVRTLGLYEKQISTGLVAIVLATILFKAVSFSPELESFSGPTMGTTYTIKYTTTADAPSREELKTLVDDVLVHVNKLMSTYDPSSELSLFNKQPAGSTVTVSDGMAYVVGEALKISELSAGKYDVTVGPLVNLWVSVQVNMKIKFQRILISQKPKRELVITMCAWKTMN